MNLAIKNNHTHEYTLIWAVVASLLLHVLFAVVVPSFKFDAIKKVPQVLEIELQKPKQSVPVATPEPPKPIEPAKPEPIKETVIPKTTPKPIAKPVETPSPIHQEAVTPPPAVDKVIVAEPRPESKSELVIPTPVEAPKSAAPIETDLSAAKGQYADTLRREIAKDTNYPNIARKRQQTGDVVLDVKLDSSGNVLSATVHTSSGYESLDKEAVAKVRRISPFPSPPDALRGRSFNVTVPISFKLENA